MPDANYYSGPPLFLHLKKLSQSGHKIIRGIALGHWFNYRETCPLPGVGPLFSAAFLHLHTFLSAHPSQPLSLSIPSLSDTHNTESTSISESGVNNSDNGNRKTQKNYKEKKEIFFFRQHFLTDELPDWGGGGGGGEDTLGVRNVVVFRLRTWLYSSFTVLGTCLPYQICQTPKRHGTWQCYVHPSYGVSKKSFKTLILCLIKPMLLLFSLSCSFFLFLL